MYIKYTFSNLCLMEKENICIQASPEIVIDTIKLQKMAFIYNAVESGWSVKKRKEAYVFTKNHEGKKEIYLEKGNLYKTFWTLNNRLFLI